MTRYTPRAVRTRLGWSLSQLAEALGVDRQTVWRWEHPEAATGRTPPPYLWRALRDLEREQRETT